LYRSHDKPQDTADKIELASGLDKISGKTQQHPNRNSYFDSEHIRRSFTQACKNCGAGYSNELNDQNGHDKL